MTRVMRWRPLRDGYLGTGHRAALALNAAPGDPEAAAEVLRIAAEYFRAGRRIPEHLARYLAEAFEATATKPARYRTNTLARLLHLKTTGRPRARASWFAVGAAFDVLLKQGASKASAAREVAVRFKVSESTARSMWKRFDRDRDADGTAVDHEFSLD